MKKIKMFGVSLLVIVLLFTGFPVESLGKSSPTYDIVIKNGKIYNPSTEHELINYNIGINDSKIERITKESIDGETEIDATGKVVSPGFIDLISYDPNSVGIELKVLDGVTSNLAMHGGTEDAATWYPSWESNGVLTNFGASSFVTRQRWPIVGQGVDTEITKEEDIKTLVEDVRKNIEAGALGISFSLEYIPGIKDELRPLLELANEYDVPTFYHLRYSDEDRGLDGIQEVIDLGKETGATIHIMHINSTGGTFVMDEALSMVKEAKEEGLDISTDFYPYDYWATYLGSTRFRPGWQEAFGITYNDLHVTGTDTRVTEGTFDKYRSENKLVAALGSMPVSELEMLLQDPDAMIGSDTIIEPHHNNHPRGAGTYSHLFGKFVREEQLLSMMDAIKKVSYFPAKRMESSAPQMKSKGRIEVGADADITIFDPDTIIDKSSVENPAAASEGVEYVIINGVVTKDLDGIVQGVAPGKPIMSYFVDEFSEDNSIDYKVKLDDEEEINIEHVYERNGRVYLPIQETFDLLDLSVEDALDGKININDVAQIEIGSKKAIVNEDEIQLTEEPIIYKEQTFVFVEDLNNLFNEYYEVNETDNGLAIKTLAGKDINKDAEEKESEDEPKNNLFLQIGIVIVLLIALVFLAVLFRRKRN